MLIQAAFAAWRQVLFGPLRRILWRTLGLTVALLVLLWFGLTRLMSYYLEGRQFGVDHPWIEGFAFFFAGAGLVIALVYFLPAVSALVAGYFLDDAAEIVERTDFAADPPGQPLPMGRALLYGLRFAGLALLVNLAALTLFFVPVVNVGVFFAANAYLLGREYFELAAGRFRPMSEAAAMRKAHHGTVLLAGAMTAALLLVPLLNLLTPLFGVALMVHVHKRLSARALSYGGPGSPARLEVGPGAR
ncbi:MAG TPA: sulfate transporter family protein [Beijerinckiaceae bacterium]|nr:sulfate transporter family protein [Beijerinckiaceae bacterium]